MNQGKKLRSSRRTGLYARVSSDRGEGTIDSQLSAIRAALEVAGDVLDRDLIFCDDGVSGATMVRPALERLRDQAALGAIDCLYVLAPDRLARRHVHQMVLQEELQGHGVAVVFVNRPLGNTPEDQLLLQVQGMVAEYERAKILERTRRGRLHAARCGQVSVLGRSSYGYRYIDKRTGCGQASLQVQEEEADVVRRMFAWVGREGCSLAEVVRRLERLEVPTRCGKKRWDRSTIWKMLTNATYRGQAAYGKTRCGERRPRLRPLRGKPEVLKNPCGKYLQPPSEHIPIAVPALVEADLFNAVQERLEENRKRLREQRRGARYLLQGLAVCGCCGYAVCGQGPNVGKRHAYYCCLGTSGYRFGGQPVCHNRRQRVEDLDALVWNDVCDLLREPDRLCQEFERRQQGADAEQGSAEQERLDKAVVRIQQSMSRLLDAYTESYLDQDEFQTRMARLQDRRRQGEEQAKAVREQAQRDEALQSVFSHVQQFADQVHKGLKTADWMTRREIIRALVKRVEVGNNTIDITYKIPPRPFAKAPEGGQIQHCCSRYSVSMRGTAFYTIACIFNGGWYD
jgi:site-specific DNA recombinase